jgi:transmembrane sensor
MEIDKFKRTLKRYIQGRSNETENALVEAWYKSYQINEQELSENDEQRISQAIQSRINAATVKPSIITLPVFRIAASLVIAVGMSFLAWYFVNRLNRSGKAELYTVQTGINSIKQVSLPDTSGIWLNSASCLQVPAAYKGHLREVNLVEGEAFFNIKRDVQHPFVIHVGKLNVEVLGTSFNIQAYKNLKSIKISVVTGKVGVTHGNRVLAMLLPGQQLSYQTNTDTYYRRDINADGVQSWKQGETYLSEADFKELALAFKNISGLTLKSGNNRVGSYHFSLRLQRNQPVDQLLKVITQIHNTHFRKEGNDIVIY